MGGYYKCHNPQQIGDEKSKCYIFEWIDGSFYLVYEWLEGVIFSSSQVPDDGQPLDNDAQQLVLDVGSEFPKMIFSMVLKKQMTDIHSQ